MTPSTHDVEIAGNVLGLEPSEMLNLQKFYQRERARERRAAIWAKAWRITKLLLLVLLGAAVFGLFMFARTILGFAENL
jgi:hypothetical protein